MTVTDNTKAGARVFFPEGMFFPQVMFDKDAETGSAAPVITTDDNTDNTDEADPNRDIDNPAADMYPDLSNKNKDKDKKANGADKGDDDDDGGDDEDDADKGDEDDADKGDDDDDEGGDDDKDADKKDVDPDSVPDEKTGYSLTMPEGMELDKGLLDAITPSLRAKGFTHKEAQELTDTFIDVRTKEIEKANEDWDNTVTDWADQTKKDKEIGGKKFDETMKAAQSALKKYGTEELRAALDNSGMGSHPEVIRLLVRVGNAITDDDVPRSSGDTRTTAPNSNAETAEELYGETTPTKRS